MPLESIMRQEQSIIRPLAHSVSYTLASMGSSNTRHGIKRNFMLAFIHAGLLATLTRIKDAAESKAVWRQSHPRPTVASVCKNEPTRGHAPGDV